MTAVLEETVLEEVRRIARTELDYHQPIEVHQSLKADLKLDSVSMITVAVGLENRFRIRLQEHDAKVETVGDLVRLVERRINEERTVSEGRSEVQRMTAAGSAS